MAIKKRALSWLLRRGDLVAVSCLALLNSTNVLAGYQCPAFPFSSSITQQVAGQSVTVNTSTVCQCQACTISASSGTGANTTPPTTGSNGGSAGNCVCTTTYQGTAYPPSVNCIAGETVSSTGCTNVVPPSSTQQSPTSSSTQGSESSGNTVVTAGNYANLVNASVQTLAAPLNTYFQYKIMSGFVNQGAAGREAQGVAQRQQVENLPEPLEPQEERREPPPVVREPPIEPMIE